jgi:hypothetical protein
MAERISWSTNCTSRHRERRTRESVSPGGSSIGGLDHSFDQETGQQLAVELAAGASWILLRQMTKPEERLHPLEAQFDLPAASIEAQDLVGRRLLRQTGPNHEELRALATLFGNFFLCFVGLKLHLPVHVPGGRCAPSDGNEASPDGISLGRQYPAGQVPGSGTPSNGGALPGHLPCDRLRDAKAAFAN